MPGRDLQWVLNTAAVSAAVTHNHVQGVTGGQAVAAAIYLARTGHSKQDIRSYIENEFDYNLQRSVTEMRPEFTFSSRAATSVPQAIIAFLDSQEREDCIRLAISLGGDSDTIAAIAGSIAQAYYTTNNGDDGGSIPAHLVQGARAVLDDGQIKVLDDFWQTFGAQALSEGRCSEKEDKEEENKKQPL